MSLIPEVGTIVSWVSNDRLDWPTNRECYVFGPYFTDGIKWRVRKNQDRTVHIWVSGPFGQSFGAVIRRVASGPFRRPPAEGRVLVTIRWADQTVWASLEMGVAKRLQRAD